MQCLAFWEMQSAEYFVLSGRKIWVWWVGYLTRGREIPGSQCMSGFQRDCCLWKCQYSTTSKNQNFKASGVYILPLEIEGSVPSGTPHALTVRLGMGGGHLPGGVGACSVPCHMSCCCLRGCHSYPPRADAAGGAAECSPCLPQDFLEFWECAWLTSLWFHSICLVYFVHTSVSFLLLWGFCTCG